MFRIVQIDGPIFRQRPTSVEADLGTTVTLRCGVDGNPSPDIEWINENSDRVNLLRNLFLLRIPQVSCNHFICRLLEPLQIFP